MAAYDPIAMGLEWSGDLDQLRAAHRRTLEGYVNALGAVDRLAPSAGRPAENPVLRPLAMPFARPFIHGHVRARLKLLSARCTQLEAALSPEIARDERQWLARVRTESDELASRLQVRQLPGLLALVSVAASMLTVGGAIASVSLPTGLLVICVVVTLLFGVGSVRGRQAGFRAKRELFLPGARELDRRPLEEQRAHAGVNVYRDEIELFELLGTGVMRREPAWDRIVAPLVVLSVAQLALLAGFVFARESLVVAVVTFGIVGISGIVVRRMDRGPTRHWK